MPNFNYDDLKKKEQEKQKNKTKMTLKERIERIERYLGI